ncbi:MAG: hypothetical protein DRJ46_03565 [Thermoprotei archaeon]|nr:MAG: hypothetical protein DRJ46_03565 [Thermoprotei archaeon]
MEREVGGGKYTTVSIPTTLYRRIKKIIQGTGFTSVSSFVTYILREVVASYEDRIDEEPFTEEDKQAILEKLRKLGYL